MTVNIEVLIRNLVKPWQVIPLSNLGPRICILGPSNSGKSTLAKAIGNKKSSQVFHLDQLFHLPNILWQERSEDDFLRLHN